MASVPTSPMWSDMKVGNKKIGLVQVDAELLQAGVHCVQAFFTIKAGINNQKPVFPFDDIASSAISADFWAEEFRYGTDWEQFLQS